MELKSSYLGHRLEILVFSSSMVFCSCLQWHAVWFRLFTTQGGDHGIWLQHGILYLLAMTCSMNQLILDTGWRSWYSAAAWYFVLVCDDMQHESGYLGHRMEIMVFSCRMVFCTCLQWHAAWIRLFRTQAGDHGIQWQHGILYLFVMIWSINQVIKGKGWRSW